MPSWPGRGGWSVLSHMQLYVTRTQSAPGCNTVVLWPAGKCSCAGWQHVYHTTPTGFACRMERVARRGQKETASTSYRMETAPVRVKGSSGRVQTASPRAISPSLSGRESSAHAHCRSGDSLQQPHASQLQLKLRQQQLQRQRHLQQQQRQGVQVTH